MMNIYKLKVTPVGEVCLFELTWDGGRQLTAQLPYPSQLEPLYQSWQQIYLNYYQSALRGRAVLSGQLTAKTDWHGQLVQAEAKLLYEFHQWLRNGALFDIRSALGQRVVTVHSGREQRSAVKNATHSIDLLISCAPALARLPWEAWEINPEFGSTQPIRIARLPLNIREAVSAPGRVCAAARVLVILGDDTGLNFSDELSAITQLKRLADITVIGWQPGKDAIALKQTICNTIQAAPGWDMLLFFGHSNEANMVGGQIAIAPSTTLSIRELDPYLRKAKSRGLQFALFNSCKGLDIADALIDLGLNQVVVMREPIHNRVAQVFFIQFMQSLARFDDVHTALQKATQSLRSESNLTYPSAHLVPSLFRHSNAIPFQLQPVGWQSQLKSFLPRDRWQSAVLASMTALSLFSPLTEPLMARRLWVQTLYRDITQPLPPEAPPPVLLIQIDDQSIREGIPDGDEPNPINRAYLAQIVDKLSVLEAQVIGIDYLLDRPQADNDDRFVESVISSVEQGTSLIFGALLISGVEIGAHQGVEVSENQDADSLNLVTMQGHTHIPRWYLPIPQDGDTCLERCPFAYLLSLTHAARQSSIAQAIAITPNIDSQRDLRRTLVVSLKGQKNQDSSLKYLYNLRLPIVSSLSRWWDQRWLHPLIDLSIPPEHVYDQLSAYQFLNTSTEQLAAQFDWQNKVVIIASGGYDEAGTDLHRDFTKPPPAIAYWYRRQGNLTNRFTGGEVNAYAVHHFLKQHYVKPIPDIWFIGLAMMAGAGIVTYFYRYQPSRRRQLLILMCFSLASGWISLHLYLALRVLLPWFLPTATLWIFCLPPVLSAPSK